MKKAFPFKKRLSAVLAAVLAVAGAAGATPANAQDKTYAYSVIGDYGNFENCKWYIEGNVRGDTLSFTGEDSTPTVTKGAENSTSADWASLATGYFDFEANTCYQISFSAKSTNKSGRIKLTGYAFGSGNPKEIVYDSITVNGAAGNETYLDTEKNTEFVARLTCDGAYTRNQFRIYVWGDEGTQITVKNFTVKKIAEQVIYKDIACLDDVWKFTGYNNPAAENCYLEVAESGCNDTGSIHFYKEYENHNEARIRYNLQNRYTSAYPIGTEFVFEANVRGTVTHTGDDFKFILDGTKQHWLNDDGSEDTSGDYYVFSYSRGTDTGWETITKSFKYEKAGDIYFTVKTGGYTISDFYIDNIKIYAKSDETKTNLLSGGDFYKSVPETTLEDWDNIGYGYEDPDASYADLTLSEDGYSNPGSVHFYSDYAVNSKEGNRKTVAIAYCLKNTEAGKKYILEAYVKGCTKDGGADPLFAEFLWGHGKWSDGVPSSEKDLRFNAIDSDDWVKISYEFTVVDIGWVPFKIYSGGYSGVDCYIDDIKVFSEDDPNKTNLISNSTFCKTNTVISDENLFDSANVLREIRGLNIGTLSNTEKSTTTVVPGGSYDGSTALKIAADGIEGYFQTNGENGITLVRGDCGVKASGYFNKLSGDDAAYAKVWMYLYNDGTYDNVSTHYTESDRYLSSEKYDTVTADGWTKFEVTLNEETTKKANDKDEKVLSKALSEYKSIKYLCGVKAKDWNPDKEYYGEALFDDIKFEIISKYAPGDSNGDGDIDIRDLVHMKKYAAGTVKFTDMTRGTWLSDIGCNESPSITNEMVCMRKYLIGASSEYGK